MTKLEPVFETTCVSCTPHKMYRLQRKVFL